MEDLRFPSAFIDSLITDLGLSESEALVKALSCPPSTSIRLHPIKMPAPSLLHDRVPWCPMGAYLEERPVFTADPAFHAGAYYVQEASSMLLSAIVRTYVQRPIRVLDLCAAPGGKTTLLEDVLPEGSLVVANEVVPMRAAVLLENVWKWGNPYAVVASSEVERWGRLSGGFDLLLADVPCSGEGMFRKDPVAVEEWSAEAPMRCAERTFGILSAAWPALSEGGLCIYSTCTFNSLENEGVVRRIAQTLGAEILPVPAEDAWGVVRTREGAHCYPHKVRGEGIFFAVLRKTSGGGHPTLKPNRVKNAATPPVAQISEWVQSPETYDFVTHKDAFFALPKAHETFIKTLLSAVNVLSAGVPLGISKGRDVAPHMALAHATAMAKGAFPTVELSLAEAQQYLNRQALMLADTPKGYAVVQYEGLPLGLVKQVGNRANNLYPAAWATRKLFTPSDYKKLI